MDLHERGRPGADDGQRRSPSAPGSSGRPSIATSPTRTRWSRRAAPTGSSLNPPPDPTAWTEIADPDERLRVALAELYGWYERHRARCVEKLYRDAPRSRRSPCRMQARAAARGDLPTILLRAARARTAGASGRAPRSATRSPSTPGARWCETRAFRASQAGRADGGAASAGARRLSPSRRLIDLEGLLHALAGAADVVHRVGAELLVLERALEQHVGREQRVPQLVREQPHLVELVRLPLLGHAARV